MIVRLPTIYLSLIRGKHISKLHVKYLPEC